MAFQMRHHDHARRQNARAAARYNILCTTCTSTGSRKQKTPTSTVATNTALQETALQGTVSIRRIAGTISSSTHCASRLDLARHDFDARRTAPAGWVSRSRALCLRNSSFDHKPYDNRCAPPKKVQSRLGLKSSRTPASTASGIGNHT